MEGSLVPENPNSEIQTAKKGKSLLKTVKIMAGGGKHQKNEGPPPPSDSWSWRKYGQKPIKGSPYPRGYYRCSTWKGCPAKKQVERCRLDASRIKITYTSTHNHPGPNLHTQNSHIQKLKTVSSVADMQQGPQLQQSEREDQVGKRMGREESAIGEHFHYLEPPNDVTSHIDHSLFSLDLGDSPHKSIYVLFDEEPISFRPVQASSSKPESDEHDFYNELEELPLSSILTFKSFMNWSFYGDSILVQPS